MSGGRSASTPTPPQVTHSIMLLQQNGHAHRVRHSYSFFNLSFSPLTQSAMSVSEGGAITQSNGEKATPPVTAARAGKGGIEG